MHIWSPWPSIFLNFLGSLRTIALGKVLKNIVEN